MTGLVSILRSWRRQRWVSLTGGPFDGISVRVPLVDGRDVALIVVCRGCSDGRTLRATYTRWGPGAAAYIPPARDQDLRKFIGDA
jgi:hypothetical protein